MIALTDLYDVTHVVSELPDALALGWGGGWILGTVSVSHPGRRERYVRYGHAYVIDNRVYSSRDIARAWVRTYYDLDRLRRRNRMWEYAPVPHLARAGLYDEAYYVDIRSLHREIIGRVGYDVEYAGPGTYMSLNPIRCALNKACYTSLSSLSINPVTVLRKTNGRGGIVSVSIRNHYANTSLYRLIRDVQLAIASDVLRQTHCVYYNTDGCIVTSTQDVDRVIDVVETWGLEARVKREGRCAVYRHALYAFGDDEIARVRTLRQRLHQPRPLDLMSERESDWLREHMRLAATIPARETCDLSAIPAADISCEMEEEEASEAEQVPAR